MPRLTSGDVCLFILRKCFRFRIVLFWFCAASLIFGSFVSILIYGLSNDRINWVMRGIPLRDMPYGCEEIATLPLTRRVGRGTTKDVYASVYRDVEVAVKMVSPKVQDIRACLRRRMFRDQEECYVYANYKLMKEIALAQQLQHPNIAKLIGYCIQSDPLFSSAKDHGVISVVEFGSKASLHRLSGISWEQRLQAALELASLLDYLEHSPLGSLAIWDYKHSQFMMTRDYKIKYSDMDDLSGDEPQCETDDQCVIPKSNRARVNCSQSRCHGFNAKFNLLRTTKEFFRPLLTNPRSECCEKQVGELLGKLNKLEVNAEEVMRMLTEMKIQGAGVEGNIAL